MARKSEGPLNAKTKRRMYSAFFIGLGVYSLLTYRLFDIQIINGDEYTKKQLSQSQQKTKLNSGRGIIYDRNNKPLTDTNKSKVLIVPNSVLSQGYEVKKVIQRATGLGELEIEKEIQEQIPSSTILFEYEKLEDEVEAELKKYDIIVDEKTDRYKTKSILTHVIGYVNESDNIGQSGLEKSMEDTIKDSNEQTVSVFKAAKTGDLLKGTVDRVKKSEDNKHLRLTVDSNVQKIVEKIVDKEENPTAVVISDVKTGEILGTTSRPVYDPSNITSQIVNNELEDGALINKATNQTFSPGSVFKIVVLYAALESGVIDENYTHNCTGSIQVGANDERLKCNNLEGHGLQTLDEAFANSCNTAFYDIASKVGKEKIFEAIEKLHIDEKLHIGIEEKAANLDKNITLRNLAIGQGSLEFTPLQINQMTQIVANNGSYKPLKLLDSVVGNNKNVLKTYKSDKKEEIISPYIITMIKQMMVGVSETGTAKNLSDLKDGSGVKTGTVQSKIKKVNEETKENETININHGWITGFYPKENPKYAITVFVEGTEKVSKPALPIFKEVCENLSKK